MAKKDETVADHFFSAQLRLGGARRLRRNLRELALYRDSTMGAVLISLVEEAVERERTRRARR